MKAIIATDLIFIILFIGAVVFSSALVFWEWYNKEKTTASETNCRMKLQSYCIDWKNANYDPGSEPDWNNLPPTEGCDQFGILRPSEADCEAVVK